MNKIEFVMSLVGWVALGVIVGHLIARMQYKNKTKQYETSQKAFVPPFLRNPQSPPRLGQMAKLRQCDEPPPQEKL